MKKIFCGLLIMFSIPTYAALLEHEATSEYGDKICIYSDRTTLKISGYGNCPRSYEANPSRPAPMPKLTPIDDLNRMGKTSLQNKYCTLLSREKSLVNSADRQNRRNEGSGNPFSASMALNTVANASLVQAERNRVAGVLESKHGIIMTESMCGGSSSGNSSGDSWNTNKW